METKKCEICGRELPISEFSKSYKNRCRECVAQMTREKRAETKKDASKSILTITPKIFDEAVWQTETELNEQAYNDWLKATVSVLQEIYDGMDDITAPSKYTLGDVINLLDSITIKVRKGVSR